MYGSKKSADFRTLTSLSDSTTMMMIDEAFQSKSEELKNFHFKNVIRAEWMEL